MNEKLKNIRDRYRLQKDDVSRWNELVSVPRIPDSRKIRYGTTLVAVGTGFLLAGRRKENTMMKKIGWAAIGAGTYVNAQVGRRSDEARNRLRENTSPPNRTLLSRARAVFTPSR